MHDIDIELNLPEVNRSAELIRRGGEILLRLVDRLGVEVGDEYFEVLTSTLIRSGSDLARPESWAASTAIFYARCILDGKTAYEAKEGRVLKSILTLSPDSEVKTITNHYLTSDGSGQNASRILRGIRPVLRMLGGDFSRRSVKHVNKLGKTDRRGEWDVLPTKEECLEAAFEEYTDGLRMIASGRRKRGATRVRDAVTMAVEICGSWRRSEFSAMDVEMIVPIDHAQALKVILPAWASKVREIQPGLIDDDRAVEMLLALVSNRSRGPVFRTNWNKQLSAKETYRSLGRASRRSMDGFVLNFNKARRISVSSVTNTGKQRQKVRHNPSSYVIKSYQKHNDQIQISETRDRLREHAIIFQQDKPDGWRMPKEIGLMKRRS